MYTKANTGNEVSQELELITEKMAFEGRAIARPNRFVIFVDGALPGEKVRAEITQRKRHHAFARVLEVLEPSPHRVTAPCPVFGECGGCSFQQMVYPAQLAMKRDVLIESLYGVPGVPDNVCEAIGADSPFYFRNKMVFAFGSLNNELVLGLHRKGQWHSVVPADACLLQSKESNEIIRRVLAFMKERGIAVFNDEKNTGLIRHLVIREGKHTNERMVHLHATAWHAAFESLPGLLGELCDTFLVSTHRNVPEAAPAEQTFVLKGSGQISDKLNDFQFEIGPSTFFQTNTIQAEKLFRVVAAWAEEAKPKNAVDLYAGTGPIGMFLSAVAEKVVCIESHPDSVAMARSNIELNGLKNVEIICAEAEKAGPNVFPKPTDLVVIDPPRPGLHKKAMQLLFSLSAPNLIYVSCNPATLARDLKLLAEGSYAVEAIQPVDMFPHTFHIEAVAKLKTI
jgi:23S rRNA (uracil1939-C5)-methyltransferase